MPDVLIVGGGLAGLALARQLQAEGHDWALVEARARLGGRILTSEDGADLGPAWIWPGQPRIAALLADLALPVFEQFSRGDLLHEDPDGQIHRMRGPGGMQGSLRVTGGLWTVVRALAADLPAERIHLRQTVRALSWQDGTVTASTATGDAFSANRVVLALPPRIAATLRFTPALPQEAIRAMAQTRTWMAGHAKAVAIYDRARWRDAGLSGDAFSRRGPMVEIHDASGPDGTGPAAIFGFLGWPPADRQDEDRLRAAVLDQLARLFGPDAPLALHLKDWAQDPLTATKADAAPLTRHPAYGPVPGTQDLWGGRLILGSTEVGEPHGGFIEGALDAAEAARARLNVTL